MPLCSLHPKRGTALMECLAFLSQLHRPLVVGIKKGEWKLLRPKGKLKGNRQIWKGRPG